MNEKTGMKKAFILMVIVAAAAPAFRPAERFDRKWEIHLIPHTHVDIGYTASQDEVLRKQWRNIEEAMDIIERTASLPEDARFKWNPEVTWAVQAWLEQASDAQRKRFFGHVRDGSIGIDAMFANMLTGLCRPEELMQAVAFKSYIEENTGVKIDSAMITDIPGWSWGMVTVLAANGVKYVSIGTNTFDHIGYTLSDWGDKPFYWASPSGNERVLCFVHGKGYSWFHSLLAPVIMKKIRNKFTPGRIFGYLRQLQAEGYPYEIVPIRYSIVSDNASPDPDISEIVMRWNREYPQARVRIMTVSQSLHEFEKRYGAKLPEYSGDFTPYWEDGAESTARETATARNASEKLDQAQTLWTLEDLKNFPSEEFGRAWKEVLLFDEHTWGAFNSVSMPWSEFAKRQWNWKKQRALDADRMAGELLAKILKQGAAGSGGDVTLEVFNTHSWPVTGPAVVFDVTGRVETAEGEAVPSQAMNDGSLYFVAENVPAMSSKKYVIKNGAANPSGKCVATGQSISNGNYTVTFDLETGAVSSIRNDKTGTEFVGGAFRDKFNEYIYIRGRNPKKGKMKNGSAPATFTVKEKGPLVCSVEIHRSAAKSSLVTTVAMYDGIDRIDITNALDRPLIRKPEGIHFAFPVAAANPKVRYDVAWGSVEVGRDQMKGSCRNYMTALRWADVSGDSTGMEFVLVDAPLFEVGDITTDANKYGWLRNVENNGAIYSYAMNNYWKTNYKADQPGEAVFRYSLFPHGEYDVASNMKRSLEVMQPLIVSAGGPETAKTAPPVITGSDDVVILSAKPTLSGDAMQVDLFNISDIEVTTRVRPGPGCPAFSIKNGGPASEQSMTFGAHELIQLICAPKIH